MKFTALRVLCTVLCLLLTVSLFAGCGDSEENYTETTGEKTSETASNENKTADTDSKSNVPEGFTTEYTATDVVEIDIKDYGVITVALDANKAPKTVENFKKLVSSGFYDGLTFHRIMEGFMMQGGDPLGNGTGGSKETIVGEFTRNGSSNNLSHIRGAISMARSTLYDSASSQFFIVHKDACDSLDGKYACFGYVTDGIEVVDKVCESSQPIDNNGTIPAANQPVINKITLK